MGCCAAKAAQQEKGSNPAGRSLFGSVDCRPYDCKTANYETTPARLSAPRPADISGVDDRLPNQQGGNGRRAHDPVGDAAEQRPPDSGTAMGGHYHQAVVRIPGQPDNGVRRILLGIYNVHAGKSEFRLQAVGTARKVVHGLDGEVGGHFREAAEFEPGVTVGAHPLGIGLEESGSVGRLVERYPGAKAGRQSPGVGQRRL